MTQYRPLQLSTPPAHWHPHRLLFFYGRLPSLLLVALIWLAGCTDDHKAVPMQSAASILTPTLESTPTASAEPKTTLAPTPTEWLEDSVLTEADITIVAIVLEIEPPGNLIVLEKRTEGFRAVVLGSSGELVSRDGAAMTLEELRPGMYIQISGRSGEGVLIAQRVQVLADSPTTIESPPVDKDAGEPVPPTPVSLSSVSSVWYSYDFPELGVNLLMPSDWEMLRMPDGYFFAPKTSTGQDGNLIGGTQLTISLKGNVPAELSAMTEDLIQEWQRLAPRSDFYTVPVVVGGSEGAAFWNLSEASCVNVYVPAHGLVHQIDFFSTFCNQDRTRLNQVGQTILDSVTFYPATQNEP